MDRFEQVARSKIFCPFALSILEIRCRSENVKNLPFVNKGLEILSLLANLFGSYGTILCQYVVNLKTKLFRLNLLINVIYRLWTHFSESFNQERLVIVCGLVRCDEPLPDEVINALTNNKAAHKLILEHFPNSLLAKTISLEDNLVKQNLTEPTTTNSPHSTKNVIKLKRKVSSLFKNSHKPLRPILKKPKTSHEDEVRISVDDNDDNEIQQPLSSSGNNNSKQPQFLSDTFCQSKEFLSGLCDCFKVWKKFMDWPYLIFALSNFILYAWYDVMYVYLYNYAETDLKINPSDATKFLSIIGILNTLGELIIGWLGDRPDVNLNFLYSICMIVCGGATAMVPFLSNYYALCVMAGLYGLCISG